MKLNFWNIFALAMLLLIVAVGVLMAMKVDGFLSDVWIAYMMAHYSILIGWLSKLIIPAVPLFMVKLAAILDPRAENNGMSEWIQLAFGHKAGNAQSPQTEGK